MDDEDYAFALQLNEYANRDEKLTDNNVIITETNKPLSVVDESWELIDPVPDIRQLFIQFNEAYFDGNVACVEVKWSSRMTLCAGLCRYEGRGGLCCINLSQPLLKLRPRKDLVNTLLHEMIHALLFVTNNNKDHDAHGAEFHKNMYRINKQSGSHITVYHSFHDEVNECRQHWWKCDGPCAKRHPFYGIVRRAMNRAPGRNDRWWSDHQKSCGGVFKKIKEPDKTKGKKKEKNLEKVENNKNKEKPACLNSKKITDFLGGVSSDKQFDPKDIEKNTFGNNKTSTSKISSFQDIKDKENSEGSQVFTASSKSSSGNVHGFKMSARKNNETDVNLYGGKGMKIGENIESSSSYGSRESFLKRIENNMLKNKGTKRTIDKMESLDARCKTEKHSKKNYSSISPTRQSVYVDIRTDSKKYESPHKDRRKKLEIPTNKSSHINSNKTIQTPKSKTSFPDVICIDDSTGDDFLSVVDESLLKSDINLVDCPACPSKVPEDKLNEHLDTCLA